ncbi:hypothetical protein Cde04nite_26670 [Cellulomonas denverensis]|uniref:(2Fe-2S) ferredoxin n=1 Tax=Cellulomonas uda TaxID=1714 RepID=A0A4Y3K7M5_CELUD|nr:hypothetical protein CUD01_01700 [Cellulomonas uda]GIG26423.1 hypothetical protein Cde04nite_26670 [Cellulomonas denverensis]
MTRKNLPGLTACSLCAGETLGEADTAPGGQLQRLRHLADSGVARLTTVDCLDACDRGDVVVARPSGACRRTGARPVWFERLAGDEVTGELARWLRCGGPGVARLPDRLVGNVIQRSDPVPAGPAA